MQRWWMGGLVLAVLAAACGDEAPSPTERLGVEAAATALTDALVARNAEALDSLLADDFLWVRNSGATGSRREFIAALTDPSLQLDPIDPIDVAWLVHGETALVVGEAMLTGRLNGQRVTDHHRFADFWVLRDGAWRLAYVQTTTIPEG